MLRLSLRSLLLFAGALAGAKVWAQDRYQRTIYHEALLQAFGERAKLDCEREVTRLAAGKPPRRMGGGEVVIGNAKTNVSVWDLDNPLWDMRYRHPHILIDAELKDPPGRGISCAYDVTAGLTSISDRRD